MAPPRPWKPGSSSPFARAAFARGTAGYRPQGAAGATGVNTFGTPAPPTDGRPIEQSNAGPPVSWPGQWRPTEAELARWGGRVVLYGLAIPDHAPTGELVDIMDATMPWPMAVEVVIATEPLAPGWVTDIDVFVQAGIGRANWQLLIDVPPTASPSHQVQRLPFRQVQVRARWRNPPVAGEVVAVSVGFGIVGV